LQHEYERGKSMRMKKWIFYIMAFLVATACVSEGTVDIDPPQPPVGGGGDDPGKVTLQIVFPRMDRSAFGTGTRAISNAEENMIDSLVVFVFEHNPQTPAPKPHSMNDTYLYRISVPKDSITPWSNDTTYKVKVTLKTMPPKGQRLICVANIPQNIDLSFLTPDVSKVSDLVAKLKFSGSPWHETPTSANYPRIPMWGQMNDTLTFIPGGTLPNVPVITMIRALAKIEVGVDVYGTGDPALGFGHIFTLDSIFVCHASKEGFIAPHADDINNEKTAVTKTNPVNISERMTVARYKFKEDPSGSRKMGNTIYVPETDSLIGTNEPAYLVVSAKYYDGTSPNGDSTYYYRIDFTRENKYKPLLRNHSYLVNILGIRMKGYTTLAEAMAAPLASVNYVVVIDASNPVSETIMDISVYKNEYMLGVNTSEVMFDWTGDWLGKPFSGGNNYYELEFYTDYENGWTAEESSSWLSINATSGSKTSPPATKLQIEAQLNTTGEERTDTITLTAGLLVKKIAVRQSGGANSVIVKSNVTGLRIPLAYAAKARAALGLPTLTGTAVGVAWSNNITTPITLSLSSTEITSGTLVASGVDWGNALVVLTAGADTVWSWHVWVINDNDGINANYHNLNSRSVFMNRLLGGDVNGSFAQPGQPYYQWGRKDPFLSGKYAVVALSDEATNMVVNAVKHPTTFYAGSAPNYNWAEKDYINNLWYGFGSNEGKKTYNDPCPSGWRVPYYQNTMTPWQNETDKNRYRNTGSISPSGTLNGGVTPNTAAPGYIWTAYASSWSAYYAEISNGGALDPFKSASRGYGYAIRCVKDISRKY
jgi:hypothetical protein